jgi:hypothetical protein
MHHIFILMMYESVYIVFFSNENEVWQELLQNKYLPSHTISQVKVKPNDLSFCNELIRVKYDFFLSRGCFKIGNGLDVRFWEDG